MSGFLRPRGLTIGSILAALLWTTGCARPDGLGPAGGTAQADQSQVPFHEGGKAPRGGDPTESPSHGLKPETDLPFQAPQNLPVGTLLTVRLQSAIFVQNPDANGTFEATIDQPVVIAGNDLLPQGTPVTGRVESARASNLKRNQGYVSLTLESIHLAGLRVPVQTSSLFVPANADRIQNRQAQVPSGLSSNPVIRLEKGHRLVFRLTEPFMSLAAKGQQPASLMVPPSK